MLRRGWSTSIAVHAFLLALALLSLGSFSWYVTPKWLGLLAGFCGFVLTADTPGTRRSAAISSSSSALAAGVKVGSPLMMRLAVSTRRHP